MRCGGCEENRRGSPGAGAAKLAPNDARLHLGLGLSGRPQAVEFWHELTGGRPFEPDLHRLVTAAREFRFSERMDAGIASQVIARLLIETGGRLWPGRLHLATTRAR